MIIQCIILFKSVGPESYQWCFVWICVGRCLGSWYAMWIFLGPWGSNKLCEDVVLGHDQDLCRWDFGSGPSFLRHITVSYTPWYYDLPISAWWFGTCFLFPYIGNKHHPNWLIISFQRGRAHPPTTGTLSIIKTLTSQIGWMKIIWLFMEPPM